MNTILARIAWRNLTARPGRTALLVVSIGVGVFGMLMFQVLMDGFMAMMVDSVVRTSMGHLQIHRLGFRLRQDPHEVVPDRNMVERVLDGTGSIVAYSPRVLARCLVSSPRASVASVLYGVDAGRESNVTDIAERVVEGGLPGPEDTRRVLAGRALAERLHVGPGDKIVLMCRDLNGEMSGAAVIIGGIFKAHAASIEMASIYCSQALARSLLSLPDGEVHEYAVRLVSVDRAVETRRTIASALGSASVSDLCRKAADKADVGRPAPTAGEHPGPSGDERRGPAAVAGSGRNVAGVYDVADWGMLAPAIKQQIDLAWVSTAIMFAIIFTVLCFGILNSFMMEIFERINEFGIVMALGTRPASIFVMLSLEGFFLGLLGCAAGTVGAVVTNILILGGRLDLSAWASGIRHFGFATVVPMKLAPATLAVCTGATIVVCVLASLYPALRAASFRPVEALRHY